MLSSVIGSCLAKAFQVVTSWRQGRIVGENSVRIAKNTAPLSRRPRPARTTNIHYSIYDIQYLRAADGSRMNGAFLLAKGTGPDASKSFSRGAATHRAGAMGFGGKCGKGSHPGTRAQRKMRLAGRRVRNKGEHPFFPELYIESGWCVNKKRAGHRESGGWCEWEYYRILELRFEFRIRNLFGIQDLSFGILPSRAFRTASASSPIDTGFWTYPHTPMSRIRRADIFSL